MSQNGTCSLKETFEAFAYFIPPHLVSSEAFSLLKSLACHLPTTASSSWVVECRLGPDPAPVDLSVRIDPSADSGREIFAGKHPVLALPDALWADLRWKQIRGFCAHWADPVSPFHTDIASLWLEFDVTSFSPVLPVPSVFLHSKSGQAAVSGTTPDSPTLEIITLALSSLLGGALPSELNHTLTRCMDAIPAQADLRWFGAMLSRDPGSIRLNIRFLSHHLPNLLDYLSQIGWEGTPDVIGAQIEKISGLVDTLTLVIDLRQGQVQPKVGIECMYHQNRQPEAEPRWQLLVDSLITGGLCTSEKGQALLNWSGYFHEKLAYVSEPHILDRRLHHIKLIYQPDIPTEAKGYLAFEHHPIHLSRFKVSETAPTQAGQI